MQNGNTNPLFDHVDKRYHELSFVPEVLLQKGKLTPRVESWKDLFPDSLDINLGKLKTSCSCEDGCSSCLFISVGYLKHYDFYEYPEDDPENDPENDSESPIPILRVQRGHLEMLSSEEPCGFGSIPSLLLSFCRAGSSKKLNRDLMQNIRYRRRAVKKVWEEISEIKGNEFVSHKSLKKLKVLFRKSARYQREIWDLWEQEEKNRYQRRGSYKVFPIPHYFASLCYPEVLKSLYLPECSQRSWFKDDLSLKDAPKYLSEITSVMKPKSGYWNGESLSLQEVSRRVWIACLLVSLCKQFDDPTGLVQCHRLGITGVPDIHLLIPELQVRGAGYELLTENEVSEGSLRKVYNEAIVMFSSFFLWALQPKGWLEVKAVKNGRLKDWLDDVRPSLKKAKDDPSALEGNLVHCVLLPPEEVQKRVNYIARPVFSKVTEVVFFQSTGRVRVTYEKDDENSSESGMSVYYDFFSFLQMLFPDEDGRRATSLQPKPIGQYAKDGINPDLIEFVKEAWANEKRNQVMRGKQGRKAV